MGSLVTPAAGGGIISPPDPRRAIHFATDGIAPPSPLYISTDDQLAVQVATSIANQQVNIERRYLTPKGEIIPQHDVFIATADRTIYSLAMQQQEGFLLSAAVWCGTAVRFNQMFVRLLLFRGPIANPHTIPHVLCQGPLGGFALLAWPNGSIQSNTSGRGNPRSITGTTPAAGAEIAETVPTNARWLLKAFRFQLSTSAAVANRTSSIVIDDGVNVLYQMDMAASQPATTNGVYNGGISIARLPTVGSINANYSLPSDLQLAAGYRIRTSTNNIQAADQYSNIQYAVEEWLET